MIKPLKFFVPPGNDGIVGINAEGVDLGVIQLHHCGSWSITWYVRIPKNLNEYLKNFHDLEHAKAHANKLYKAWVRSLMEEPLT